MDTNGHEFFLKKPQITQNKQKASQTSIGCAIGVPPLAGAGETHAPPPSVCSAVVMPLGVELWLLMQNLVVSGQ